MSTEFNIKSIDKGKIKGLSVFKFTLEQYTLNEYLDSDSCLDFNQLKTDLFSKSIQLSQSIDKSSTKESKEVSEKQGNTIKSLYSLFHSLTPNEISWFYTAPILEEIKIESDIEVIEGREVMKRIKKEQIEYVSIDGFGVGIDEKLIHLFVEIPILSIKDSILLKDSFDDDQTLEIDNINNLRFSFGQTPSQKAQILQSLYTDGGPSFYWNGVGTSNSLKEQDDWQLDPDKPALIYLYLINKAGDFEFINIDDAINSKLKLMPDFNNTKYINPTEIDNVEAISFSIRLNYLEGSHTEFEDIEKIDEEDLEKYIGDYTFKIYTTKIIININDKEHIIHAKEFDSIFDDSIWPKKGKVIVYTDSRESTFSNSILEGKIESPDYYWECERLRKDILKNSIDLDGFEYNSEDKNEMFWEYKGERISSEIEDVSNESITVLVDGYIEYATRN